MIDPRDWQASEPAIEPGKNLKAWTKFLELIGVVDGLRPCPAKIARKGEPSHLWQWVLHSGNAAEGLDEDWCGEVFGIRFRHPRTNYEMKGNAWRLPGQIEHETLPDKAKEAFCSLAFEHLKTHGDRYFRFKVGRFERPYKRDWHPQELPTPLSSFLRSKAWILATNHKGSSFKRPGECWASRQDSAPPRFVNHLSGKTAGFAKDEEMAKLFFGDGLDGLGSRDWHSQETAIDRLRDLAGAVAGLAASDHQRFRNECRRAWKDVEKSGGPLPFGLDLIVARHGRLEILHGNLDSPSPVIVAEDAQRSDARALSEAGRPILDVGPSTSIEQMAHLLEETGGYAPQRLEEVELLVDGEPFVPCASDVLLISLGLDWLPEIAVIGNESLGTGLESGILSSTIDQRVRTIRIRRCKTMALAVDEEKAPLSGPYAFEHEKLPTLVLVDGITLDWKTLASQLSGYISRLIDRRINSLERLMEKLVVASVDDRTFLDGLSPPSDVTLARVFGCDVQAIQERRAELWADPERLLDLLTPVVAYFGDLDLAQRLQSDSDRGGARHDLHEWLKTHLARGECPPDEMIKACKQAANQSELRRVLNLDYEKFNRILLSLGKATLSNEAELRRQYSAHLKQLRPTIMERLRRHHISDFREGKDLTTYVERKNLEFLIFNKEWILTQETLDREHAEAYVQTLLTEILESEEDASIKLSPLARLVEKNRMVVQEAITNLLPMLRDWCQHNDASLPEPWRQGKASAIVELFESKGLLDFELVKPESIPAFCRRVSCWPPDMPETLDESMLKLDKDSTEQDEEKREGEQHRETKRSLEAPAAPSGSEDADVPDNVDDLPPTVPDVPSTPVPPSPRKPTEVESPGTQRRGQAEFREALLRLWKHRCPLTGVSHRSLLRASHIKPWKDCDDHERLDPNNGLLLVANLDRAFEVGLIGFKRDGTLLISQALSPDDVDRLGLRGLPPLEGLNSSHERYLAYHRAMTFKGKTDP